MSDEGLCVGAAYAMWSEMLAASGGNGPVPPVISDVYSGPEYSEQDIRQALESCGLAYDRPNRLEHEVARLLADGYVVARFHGRMEYGPRALGNRSILYHPTDRSVNDWLNKNLVRTEFMPFAPATLYEDAEHCYVNMKGAKDAARFMTITFECTPWMQDVCQGVVHLDGTARPQLVREQDNPSYYRILSEFKKITGIPSVINTSFNMHEEPIVCSPHDAIRAFKLGHLDYLAIGPFLIKCPGNPEHSLRPCRRVTPGESN
jgi:carbamoyltransferase